MANAYATAFDLMDRVSIPPNDSREAALVQIMEAASRWVDHETTHRFYAVTETRYYNALDRSLHSAAWDLDTLERPFGSPQRIAIDDCLSVSQVATDEDGDGTYERIWSQPSDYWVGPRNAPANGKPYSYLNRNAATSRYLFPLWEEGISVTGSFGWCTLANRPPDVRELTLAVAELMARPIMDMIASGIESYAIGADLRVQVAADALPQMAQQILRNYRNEHVV